MQGPKDCCPYLGLITDPDTRCTSPDAEHRCFRSSGEQRIPLDFQEAVCFAPAYERCEAFREALAEAEPTTSGRGWVIGAVGVAAALFVVAVVAAMWLLPSLTGSRADVVEGAAPTVVPIVVVSTPEPTATRTTVPTATPSPTVAPTKTPTPKPTPTTAATATPKPKPTATPTTRPTSTATAKPSATTTATAKPSATATGTAVSSPVATRTPVIHTVVKGETLALIAKHYGTTITAIAEANNIVDRTHIRIGQKLIIP